MLVVPFERNVGCGSKSARGSDNLGVKPRAYAKTPLPKRKPSSGVSGKANPALGGTEKANGASPFHRRG